MLTASAQKYFGNEVSFNMVQASSLSNLFFLSHNPFCCGVLGVKKLCLISYFSQKYSFEKGQLKSL